MQIVSRSLFSFAKVGFIGLGNMGFPMAINLASKGHEVYAYDTKPEKALEAVKHNIIFRTSIKEVAKDTNTFITIVPRIEHVRSVLESEEGLFRNAEPGSIIIDSSTISPKDSAAFAKEAKNYGMTYVDAPVGGGVTGSKAGTLTFMVGAESEEIFERTKAIVSAMGINFFNCGKAGAGQVAKICNNMALAIQFNAISQALALGKANGLDDKTLSNIMKVSSARCWVLENYNPIPGVLEGVPSSRDYNNGFDCSLMFKDMNLATDLARESKMPVQFGEKAKEVYGKMSQIGYEKKDMSAVYDALLKHLL